MSRDRGTVGVMLAFATGYVLGARARREELDEIKDAFVAVLSSEQFADLAALARAQVGYALRELAGMVDGSSRVILPAEEDLVERVKGLFVKQ